MAVDIRAFEKNWREAIASRSHHAVERLLADTMTFHSPAIFKPVTDRDYIDRVLGFVSDAFEDFHYTDVYDKPNGLAMAFAAKVEGLTIEGIDLFTLNDDGKVCELKVMLRPLNATMAMAEKIKGRFEAMAAAD